MKQHLTDLINSALQTLVEQGTINAALPEQIQIDRTRDKAHGDLASNVALTLSKKAGMKPRDLAASICEHLPDSEHVTRTEIAGPGFINFYLGKSSIQAVVNRILEQGIQYGTNTNGANRKVQVEFVSANPTGPLHVGHGRGAAVGDCISRLMENSGWQVTREFYYNDAGQQITNLALSVQARCHGRGPEHPDWPADGYRGDYINDVAIDYMAAARIEAADKNVVGKAEPDNLQAIQEFAVAYLRREQDLDLRAFCVDFDVFFLESSLYQSGAVETAVQRLVERGYTYEEGGALWLRTTDFGDDKDRVMRKSEGGYTYFVPDVAYHLNKWERGFERVINEQGADHHSTVTRVRAGLQALELDIPAGWPDYVLHQMVLVMRGGEEVKISKRAGSYVTLRDLIDEVGCDATRYFLCSRAPSSQLTFDIDLALSQSNDNPVYYIQYAHARTCSVMRKLAEQGMSWSAADSLSHLALLTNEHETALLNQLDRYPEVAAMAAEKCEPHAVATYLRELAADFHTWYNAHKMLVEEADIRDARLALSQAVRQVLANGLALLGVSAPESM